MEKNGEESDRVVDQPAANKQDLIEPVIVKKVKPVKSPTSESEEKRRDLIN